MSDMLEYMRDCSEEGIENFVLKQSEIAALLRRQIRGDVDQLIEALVNVEVANLLMHRGAELAEIASARQGILLRFERRKRA